MTPFKQLVSGPNGDCVRTCIASLLNMEPSLVPHFFEGLGEDDGVIGWSAAEEWLEPMGAGLFYIGMPGTLTVNELLGSFAFTNPDAHFMLCGQGANGGMHCVVCKGDRIIHDPSWGSNGIVGPGNGGTHYLIVVIRLT